MCLEYYNEGAMDLITCVALIPLFLPVAHLPILAYARTRLHTTATEFAREFFETRHN